MSAFFLWLLKAAIPFLVDLALKWGLPALATAILKKWPFLSADAVNTIEKIVADAIAKLANNHPSGALGRSIRGETIDAVHKECIGGSCAANLK